MNTDQLVANIVRQESALTKRIVSDREELIRLTAENARLRRQNARYLTYVAAARRSRDNYKKRHEYTRAQLRDVLRIERSEDRNAV